MIGPTSPEGHFVEQVHALIDQLKLTSAPFFLSAATAVALPTNQTNDALVSLNAPS